MAEYPYNPWAYQFPYWVAPSCNHCYCMDAAPDAKKPPHKECCKCHDKRAVYILNQERSDELVKTHE